MELIKKLNKIQQELKAPKNQKNTFGNYNYRSCEDILEAVKPLIPDGVALTLTDEIVQFGNRLYVKATATLEDGEDAVKVSAYAREAETKKGMDEAQITGSASSYARKYALNGLFLIDDTKDADTQDNRSQATVAPKKAYTAPTAKPYIKEHEFVAAIAKMLENKTIMVGTPVQEVVDYLEMRFQISPAYRNRIESEINKQALNIK